MYILYAGAFKQSRGKKIISLAEQCSNSAFVKASNTMLCFENLQNSLGFALGGM